MPYGIFSKCIKNEDRSNYGQTKYLEIFTPFSIVGDYAEGRVGINYYFNSRFGVEIIIPYMRSRNITSDYTDVLYNGFGPTLGLTIKVN